MPLQFACPACGARLTVPDKATGKTGPCPKCKAQIAAPRPADPAGASLAPTGLCDCPACGQKVSARAVACPHCGDPLAQGGQLAWMPLRNEGVCPNCCSDHRQKVSAIVGAGTWSSVSNSVGLAQGGASDGTQFSAMSSHVTCGSGSTQLADRLAPPPMPSAETAKLGVVFAIPVLVIAFLTCGGVASANEQAADVAFGIFILVGVGCLLWIVSDARRSSRAKRAAAKAIPRWRQMVAKWEALYYCHQCDCVFDPNTRQAVPAKDMKSLLG